MKFSLFYFADAVPDRPGGLYDLLLTGARFADEHDFEAVWTPERHFHPFGGPYPNPSVTSAAVAAVTSRVGVRAGSVVAPLHDPLRIAEEWSVVDNLSHGRAGLAFASGWNPVDFAFRPDAYPDRAAVLLDTLAKVRELWSRKPVTVRDGKGESQEVVLHPRPVQHDLPVWITSAGNVRTFESAGRLGAGVLTHLVSQDADQLAVKIAAYRQAAESAAGRGSVVVMLHTLIGTDRDQVREVVRQPMLEYLRSSLDLVSRTAQADPRLAPEEVEQTVTELLDDAFERYFADGGLFGTVEDGRRRVAQLRAIGVDEVACLIDFGLPDQVVLDGLVHLDALRRACAQ
ncbi:LLM class flavin-dependent oxidoreductase [Micromonospora sp. R77]|uniref:MupA/Atu3671 family FMN-dependent luciferase-like monooxygenase n=1 Tax=Micromonospora sp. R77 TaxID=2925836 RepID=UPI001F615599|nr:MupA/Atu3671 family FMN-dependent luciferase-like monooxygenase [Micromonospora sp. R77]MCI4066803.1 LLM class flavin-dependent oxidoreductase [Micromonospora sp. R77]